MSDYADSLSSIRNSQKGDDVLNSFKTAMEYLMDEADTASQIDLSIINTLKAHISHITGYISSEDRIEANMNVQKMFCNMLYKNLQDYQAMIF